MAASSPLSTVIDAAAGAPPLETWLDHYLSKTLVITIARSYDINEMVGTKGCDHLTEEPCSSQTRSKITSARCAHAALTVFQSCQ